MERYKSSKRYRGNKFKKSSFAVNRTYRFCFQIGQKKEIKSEKSKKNVQYEFLQDVLFDFSFMEFNQQTTDNNFINFITSQVELSTEDTNKNPQNQTSVNSFVF
jgi:hypothetical protein